MNTKITPDQPKTKEDNKLKAIMLLARAFGLPVAGINLEERLGKKAYINSLGLDCAWKRWPDAIKITEVKRLDIYKQIGDVAIVEVIGQDKQGGVRSDIGSASAANMILIKGYPNELSSTRALNRVLRRVLLPYLYEEYEKNVASMTKEEQDLLAEYVSDFGRVSAEEMVAEGEGDQTQQTTLITNEEMEGIKSYLEKILNAQTLEALEDVGKLIKEASLDLTEAQTTRLRTAYKNKKNVITSKEKENEKHESKG